VNKRERLLLGIIGALLVVVVLSFGGRRVWNMYSTRHDRIARLQDQIQDKERRVRRGKQAAKVLEVYAERSLPSNPQLANSRYRAWLVEWTKQADVNQPNIQYQSGRKRVDLYNEYTFDVTCLTDLPHLVRLLYGFYTADHLHRIKQLTIRTRKDNQLQLTFNIEALSLPVVPADRSLTTESARRLALNSLDDYLHAIVDRNYFGPGNKPPKFATIGPQTAYRNRPFSFSPPVSDPEKGKLTYQLDKELPGVEIDKSTGRIKWEPTELGELEIPITVTDDGIPAKSDHTVVKVAVQEPPPEREPVRRPSFDRAKYTFLTGIVEVNGTSQALFTSRTDDKRFKVHEGDTLKTGEFEGVVQRITPKNVEILSGGQVVLVKLGQAISDGQVLGQAQATSAKSEEPGGA
jgi:hypothetical protein